MNVLFAVVIAGSAFTAPVFGRRGLQGGPDESFVGESLLWEGQVSYFQASQAQVTMENGTLTFPNDLSRKYPPYWSEGDEIVFADEGNSFELSLSFFGYTGTDVYTEPHLTNVKENGYGSLSAALIGPDQNGTSHYWYASLSEDLVEPVIQVPAEIELWFCDDIEFDLNYHDNEASNVIFNAQDVILGAFLPQGYNACRLNVHYPCGEMEKCIVRTDNLTCSPSETRRPNATELILSDCIDQEESTPDPLANVSSGLVPSLLPGDHSLRWIAERAYMQASYSNFTYADGKYLDTTIKTFPAESGAYGEQLHVSWQVQSGTFRRALFDFVSLGTYDDWNPLGAAEGWILSSTLVNDDSDDWLYMNGEDVQYPPPNTSITVAPGQQAFHCEYVEFNVERELSEPRNAGRWILHDFIVGAFLPEGYDICSLRVHNPCAAQGKQCHSVDGNIACLPVPNDDSSASIMNSWFATGASTSREYIECEASQTEPDIVEGSVQMKGLGAYFQAKQVSVDLDDGSSYTFDFGDDLMVDSAGLEGYELDATWREEDFQRRVMLYFQREGDYGYDHTQGYYWRMYEARLYDHTEHWIFWDEYRNNSVVQVPPGYDMFHCESIEMSFWREFRNGENETSTFEDGAGTLKAANFFIAPYLAFGYDVCSLKVYNPCQESQNSTFCQIKNNILTCVEDGEAEAMARSSSLPTFNAACRPIEVFSPTSSPTAAIMTGGAVNSADAESGISGPLTAFHVVIAAAIGVLSQLF